MLCRGAQCRVTDLWPIYFRASVRAIPKAAILGWHSASGWMLHHSLTQTLRFCTVNYNSRKGKLLFELYGRGSGRVYLEFYELKNPTQTTFPVLLPHLSSHLHRGAELFAAVGRIFSKFFLNTQKLIEFAKSLSTCRRTGLQLPTA